jgi:hypothetical protein
MFRVPGVDAGLLEPGKLFGNVWQVGQSSGHAPPSRLTRTARNAARPGRWVAADRVLRPVYPNV